MDRKKRNWISMSIMCSRSNIRLTLMQVFIGLKVLWITSIQIIETLLKLHHMMVEDIGQPLLMITLERFGYIYIYIYPKI